MKKLAWIRLALVSCVPLAVSLGGCPADDPDGSLDAGPPPPDVSVPDAAEDPRPHDGGADADLDGGDAAPVRPASTHSGTISVQDRVLLGAPALGHGISVLVDFAAQPRQPDVDDTPGQITGCKAWSYDVDTDPPPQPAGDVGTLRFSGLAASLGSGCVFRPASGYVCPTAAGQSALQVQAEEAGSALVSLAGAAFGAEDRGRTLRLGGTGSWVGAFPLVEVLAPTRARIARALPTAVAESVPFEILAGAGPVPGTPADEQPGDPLRNADSLRVVLDPAAGSPFAFPEAVVPDVGDAFVPDDATRAMLESIPTSGESFRIGCNGTGGTCGTAPFSILQLQSTDGDVAGLSPFALPPPVKKQISLTCVIPGALGEVVVPAAASALLAAAHLERPITRIRTAFMRNGAAIVQNPSGAANTVRVVVGHQVIGFTTP